MSERVQTLVACDLCERGYPIREMQKIDGEALVCPVCARERSEGLHDCDKEYRADCARCNGVSPMDAGCW